MGQETSLMQRMRFWQLAVPSLPKGSRGRGKYDCPSAAFHDINHDGFVNGDDYDEFAEAFEAGC